MEINSTNYKKYNSKNILKQICLKKFLKKILKIIIQEDKNNTLLDAGYGEGFISNIIYNKTNIKDITGIDINKESLKYAKKQNKKIKYKYFDLYNLNNEKKYDIVIILEVLEHLEYPEKVLKEVYKVSNKKMIISVPNEPFFSIGNLLSLKNIKRLGRPIDHVNFWSKKSFSKFLIESGIKEFKLYTSFPWIIVVINKKKTYI